MGETFQLYLKSECTGLIFYAIDLNLRKIMTLKKSFSLDSRNTFFISSNSK